MPSFNRVILAGHLTRDPEVRHTPNGATVAAFGLAMNRKWKNDQGESQEEVTFVDCEAWNKTGEVIADYLRKGRPALIEGRLKLDQWQDQDGNNRQKLKVVVQSFCFLDSAQDSGNGDQQPPAQQAQAAPDQQPQPAPPVAQPAQAIDEADIPF